MRLAGVVLAHGSDGDYYTLAGTMQGSGARALWQIRTVSIVGVAILAILRCENAHAPYYSNAHPPLLYNNVRPHGHALSHSADLLALSPSCI